MTPVPRRPANSLITKVPFVFLHMRNEEVLSASVPAQQANDNAVQRPTDDPIQLASDDPVQPLNDDPIQSPNDDPVQQPNDSVQKSKIAKVSMLYGQALRPQYVKALKTHQVHNERFHYAMHVLEQDALGGYWNKPTYLLALIMQELAKPPAERLHWLMWVDADLLIVNPGIPLETFLPPADMGHIHFLGSRDHNGLNTGTFFLRVSAWSVHMLTKALALPLTHPEIDLGNSMDQVAMSLVMSEDYNLAEPSGPSADAVYENADASIDTTRAFLFQPREWYNTYEFSTGYEGGEPHNGYLLVHFPGLEEARWSHMDNWLDEIHQRQGTWDVPLDSSIYAEQVPKYWRLVSESYTLVRGANKTLAHLSLFKDDDRYKKIEGLANDCSGLLTNTSYSIGPGRDMLAEMGIANTALRAALSDVPFEH